jgi:acetyl-CoA/propionyl-CoA carboxylase biotin carboxyl carrier protein
MGEGIRVDSSLLQGLTIPAAYDPMISRSSPWGSTRTVALDRLDAALAGSVVLGIDTNTEYLRLLIRDEDVRAGRLDTTLIERKMPGLPFRRVTDAELAVIAAGMISADGGEAAGRAGGRKRTSAVAAQGRLPRRRRPAPHPQP